MKLVTDGEGPSAALYEPNLDLRIVIPAGLVPLGRDCLPDGRGLAHGCRCGLDRAWCERQHHQQDDCDAGRELECWSKRGSMRAMTVRDSLQVVRVYRRTLPPDERRLRNLQGLREKVGHAGPTGPPSDRTEYTTDGSGGTLLDLARRTFTRIV